MNITKRTWAEIDIAAAKHNFEYIKKSAPLSEIMAVVKADAYGHSAEILAPLYEKWGAEYFAVSNIDEAVSLRNYGIHKPILILGYTPIENTAQLIEFDITQAVYSEEYAEMLNREAESLNKKVKVYIKLDTGMGRIGFNCRDESLPEITKAINAANLPYFKTEGVFMHFALADRNKENEDGFTDIQYKLFNLAKEKFINAGINVHFACCNSAAILNDAEKNTDICRPGIILYGLSPDNSLDRYKELVPVMTLKSVVSNIKYIKKGETVSYGRTFKAEKDTKVATISIGYADGYPRALSNKGFVFINGKKAPVIGRVCMDQIMICADGIDMKIGDTAELFGKNISVSELAELTGTINYEIVCGITHRVPRISVNGENL